MMNPAISKMPYTVGHAVLHSSKQALTWAFHRFMMAPAQNLALGFMGVAMVFSASNALYWQTSVHPAPMFAQASTAAMNLQHSGEVIPMLQAPHPLEMAVSRAGDRRAAAQTQSQSAPAPIASVPVSQSGEVTNEMLASAQSVLSAMGLFSGKVDGFYGPLTAEAIRAYETRNGLAPKGALEPVIINRINSGKSVAAPVSVPTIVPQAAIVLPTPAQVVPHEASVQPAQEILAQLTSNAAQAVAVAVPALPTLIVAPTNPQVDKVLIERIQSGLSNLGFYQSSMDGIAGESTTKAIREFENFLSFEMTGLISNDVQQWLVDAGAYL